MSDSANKMLGAKNNEGNLFSAYYLYFCSLFIWLDKCFCSKVSSKHVIFYSCREQIRDNNNTNEINGMQPHKICFSLHRFMTLKFLLLFHSLNTKSKAECCSPSKRLWTISYNFRVSLSAAGGFCEGLRYECHKSVLSIHGNFAFACGCNQPSSEKAKWLWHK